MKRLHAIFSAIFFISITTACVPVQVAPQIAAAVAADTPVPPTVTAVIPPVYLLPATITPTTTATPFRQDTSTPFPTQGVAAILPISPIQLPANYGPDPEDYPFNVNPLTGLIVPDANILNRRPMAIKITNFPRRTRPQAGLTKADLVFEYYLEFGLTRFIAIFYGNDAENIGPVRSGRIFDENVVRMYDALFAFKSADSRVLERFHATEFSDRLFYIYCPPLCKDNTKEDYNNIFTNTSDMMDAARTRGVLNQHFDQSGMRFNTILPWGGTLGLEVYTRYSTSSYKYWKYNPATQRYDRFQEIGEQVDGFEEYTPLTDSLTGQSVSADNVVILYVPHEFFLKKPGTEIVEMDLTGVGRAYVFREGRAFEATWLRDRIDGPITLHRDSETAAPLALKPGTTFFQVITTLSEMDQPTTGEYRFDFILPPDPETPTPEAP